MKIKVLGSGCPSCKKMLALTEKAVKEMDIDADVIYVTDIKEIIKTGLMSTPGLIVDDEIKVMGRIPKLKEIKRILAGEG